MSDDFIFSRLRVEALVLILLVFVPFCPGSSWIPLIGAVILPMGGWPVAQRPILVTTITLERLRKRGYEALPGYYEKIAPHLNEPLYTRTVRTVV